MYKRILSTLPMSMPQQDRHVFPTHIPCIAGVQLPSWTLGTGVL